MVQERELATFANYEQVRKAILHRNVTPKDLALIQYVIRHPGELQSRLAFANRTGKRPYYFECYKRFIAALPTSNVIYDYLSRSLNHPFIHLLERNRGKMGRIFAWGWGYRGRAAIYSAIATGEQRFTELAMEIFYKIIEERDDKLGIGDSVRGRILKSWSVYDEQTSKSACEVTATGLILLPACEALLNSRFLDLDDATYNTIFCNISESLEEFEKEELSDPEIRGSFFRSPFDNSIEALNHTHVFAAVISKMYQLTGDRKYLRSAQSIGRFFIESWIQEEGNSLSWPYAPSPKKYHEHHPFMSMEMGNLHTYIGGEPFYKAGITVEFPVAAHDAKILFTTGELRKMASSLLNNVIKNNSELNLFISPRKFRTADELIATTRSAFTIIFGFALLDKVNPDVRRKLVGLLGERPDLFPGGWFGGAASSMALAHFMIQTPYKLDE